MTEPCRPLDAKAPPPVAPAAPRRTLASRLTGLSLGAAALALLVAGPILNGAMFLIERQALQNEATAQAQVVAANTSAALLFGDHAAAQETLDSLSRSPRVAQATLYDLEGRRFADYRRDAAASGETPVLEPAGVQRSASQLVVVEPVASSTATVGWLRLSVPMAPLYREAALFAGITAAATAMALLLAWALAVGVRRAVGRVEQRLDDLAYRDPVTGLYNRHAAAEHLAEYGARADAAGKGYSIVSFDLDNFKTINDTLGHPIGDAVLREVAQRLQLGLRPGARAYRFGGDEFVVVCPCPEGLADPARYGQLVRQTLSGTLRIEGYEISLSGSVGVARYPHDGATGEDVLRAADMAMYQAKLRGKNSLSVYDGALREASQNRLRVESDLREALRDNQLRLFYQPIVELASGRVVGAEALVRWQHPIRGLLGPLEFIGTAEASGLVVPLGGWVLGEAARQLAQWHRQGLTGLRVAVNVSARQLRGGRLLGQFRQAVSDAGCDPATLGLEIELTEHTLVEDLDENLKLLHQLRDEGVHIAIDDFGTGLSSLAYLKRLPIDKIKIDRSFVSGLPDDVSDHAIVGAALSMASALGLAVVAEGVERVDQHDELRQLGCGLGQGWLYGRPMPAEAFELLARERAAGPPPPARAGAPVLSAAPLATPAG